MTDNNRCRVCDKPILVQIQKNTGLCSQVCENIESGKTKPATNEKSVVE